MRAINDIEKESKLCSKSGHSMWRKKSDYACLDIIKGRRKIEARLMRGEQVRVQIWATIDPDIRQHSDDGTSTEFKLVSVTWEEDFTE